MSSVLALDLGTQLGWAFGWRSVLGNPANIFSGSINLASGWFANRYRNFVQHLGDVCEMHGEPTRVWYEKVYQHQGTRAAHVYGSFEGHLEAWADERNIPLVGIGVGTIKKFATGKGNAKKHEMIAAIVSRGYRPVDDNEADAIALALLALEPDVASPAGAMPVPEVYETEMYRMAA